MTLRTVSTPLQRSTELLAGTQVVGTGHATWKKQEVVVIKREVVIMYRAVAHDGDLMARRDGQIVRDGDLVGPDTCAIEQVAHHKARLRHGGGRPGPGQFLYVPSPPSRMAATLFWCNKASCEEIYGRFE